MMTTSTRIWFQFIRVRVAIGMIVVFAFQLLITVNDPPLDPEYLVVIPFLGFLATFLMSLHSLLGNTMFPVSNREVAWIPMEVWGLVSLAGVAGCLFGQLWTALIGFRISLLAIPAYWIRAIWVWPCVVFPTLILWRGLRYNLGFVGFMGFLPFLMIHKVTDSRPGLIALPYAEAIQSLWPLWALGCVFLVWEAPQQMAMLRRLDVLVHGPLKVRIPVLHGEGRPSFATRCVDALMMLLFLALIGTLVVVAAQTPWSQLRSNPNVWFLLILAIVPFAFAGGLWRAARASGIGPFGAAGFLLVALTGFGYTFRKSLGVAQGMPVACGFCGGWRFAWQPACPHCADRGTRHEEAAKRPQQGIAAVLWPRYDPSAMFYRVFGPVYMLFLILIFNMSRWFGH